MSKPNTEAVFWSRVKKTATCWVVNHSCDNRLCCRIEEGHAYEGTQRDNMHDRKQHGRWRGAGYGEKNPSAKLTEEAVREIRASTESQSTLARRFGVNQSQISRARSIKRWKAVI